jgi:CheY-like chemotaxis protein
MAISVLVVEDQTDLQETIKELLEPAGYVVYCARTPDEALHLLGRLLPPCILLWDALMPRQSFTMVDRATLDGVHVAILPVTVVSMQPVGSSWEIRKRLSSKEAVLKIVQEHCPIPKLALA